MAQNNDLKKYDFIEGIDFDGLMPKAIDGFSIGDGGDAKSNHLFKSAHLGADALEVISINAFFEKKPIDDKPQGDEVVITRPTETENTPEQQQAEQDMIDALTDESGGTKAYSAVIPSINNMSVPAEAGRSATISGDVQNGATITNESTGKYVAPGYKVVESVEDGKKVYEVVKE